MDAARRERRRATKPPLMLVGVDGSEPSIHALRWALGEAARTHSSICAAYVYAVPAESGWSTETAHPKPLVPDRAAVVDCAHRELDRAVRRAAGDARVRSLSTVVVPDATPASGLVGLAATATVLVVGERRGSRGRRLGSTTSALLEAAPCPVLVVPERSESVPEPRAESRVAVGATRGPGSQEC
jgi:nucleotide-binding universal stress UspA family protein